MFDDDEDDDENYEELNEPRENLEHSRSGRPLSRNGSLRSRGNSAPRYIDDFEDDFIVDRWAINRKNVKKIDIN